MKSCQPCKFAWLGNPDKKANFVLWHCRIPNKPLVLIGNDKDFALSKACKAMVKL